MNNKVLVNYNEIAYLTKLIHGDETFLQQFDNLSDNTKTKVQELLQVSYLPNRYFLINMQDVEPNIIKSPGIYYKQSKHNDFMFIVTSISRNNSKAITKSVIDFLNSCPNPQQEIYLKLLKQELSLPFSYKSINKYLPSDYKIRKMLFKNTNKLCSLNTQYILQPKIYGKKLLCIIENGYVMMFNGNDTRVFYPEIEKELKKITASCILYGVIDSSDRFCIVDLLKDTEELYGKTHTPLQTRLLHLDILGLTVKFDEQVIKIVEAYNCNDLETLFSDDSFYKYILKESNSVYDTSRTWFDLSKYSSSIVTVSKTDGNKIVTKSNEVLYFCNKDNDWLRDRTIQIIKTINNKAVFIKLLN